VSGSVTLSLPGSYEFWATYSGDLNNVGSTSACGSETVAITAPIGGKTIGFWRNKNGQAIITNYCLGGTSSASDDLTTYLRQFKPYQNLSPTATCSQVATYVTNIINAATKNKINDPSNMNAMLRAQMLATALNVYFSDPALGGNRIGAAVPIGGLVIDLTNICKMIDSSSGTAVCTGTEDGRPAFNGQSSMTVSQMLTWAASQAASAGGADGLPGGTGVNADNPSCNPWYGQNKTLQGLAKDAFDSINNSVAIVI
jgi:hypothetical protein